MSAYVEEILLEIGLDMRACIEDHPGWGILALAVEHVRRIGLDVQLRPQMDEGPKGAAHAVMVGDFSSQPLRQELVRGGNVRIWPTVC